MVTPHRNARTRRTLRSKKSPLVKNQTVFNIDNSEEAARMQSAIDESQRMFASKHPEYQVDPDSRFLMTNPRDINTIFFASSAKTPKTVRPEYRLPNGVFKRISTAALMGKLARLPSRLTREQVEPLKSALRDDFLDFIEEIQTGESSITHHFGMFMQAGAIEVAALRSGTRCGAFCTTTLVGAAGVMAVSQADGRIDETAGVCCRPDFLIKMGYSSLQDFLLASECKIISPGKVNESWLEHDPSLLCQLLTAMIGSSSRIGLYMCNYGITVLYMEPSASPDGFTDCSLWDNDGKIFSFVAEEDAELILDFFIEVIRLSLSDEKTRTLADVREILNENASQLKNAKKRQREVSRDRRMKFKTADGLVANATCLDLDSRLTPQEKSELLELEAERIDLRRFNEQQTRADLSEDLE